MFLPFLDAQTWKDAQGVNETMDELEERRAQQARELFVASTRARDRLWLGWSGTPTLLIASAVELIEGARP